MTTPAEELIDAVLNVVRAFRDGRQLTPAVAALTHVWEKHPKPTLDMLLPATDVKTPRDAQLAFRESLRLLCVVFNEGIGKGKDTTQAAQIVAQECMQMASFFVANGPSWTADQFAAECREMFEWHKKNPPRPDSPLN